MKERWTDQSTPGIIKCARCGYAFPAYTGAGQWFESMDGSARTNYDAIVAHARDQHPDFYNRKFAAEVAPTGVKVSPEWELKI